MGHECHCCQQNAARVGKSAPAFAGRAYFRGWEGGFKELKLEDYQGQWLFLYFYPLDFTSVCPTEIIAYNERFADFEARNCAVLGCSTDSEYAHRAWVASGELGDLRYPLLADMTKRISRDYDVLHPERGYAYRGSFLISPEGVLRHLAVYEVGIGRSVEETLRVLDALLSGGNCPANWKKDDNKL